LIASRISAVAIARDLSQTGALGNIVVRANSAAIVVMFINLP
jgi:hypothetical protein